MTSIALAIYIISAKWSTWMLENMFAATNHCCRMAFHKKKRISLKIIIWTHLKYELWTSCGQRTETDPITNHHDFKNWLFWLFSFLCLLHIRDYRSKKKEQLNKYNSSSITKTRVNLVNNTRVHRVCYQPAIKLSAIIINLYWSRQNIYIRSYFYHFVVRASLFSMLFITDSLNLTHLLAVRHFFSIRLKQNTCCFAIAHKKNKVSLIIT